MQWESGRTPQNLLHAIRESKAKRQTISGVLFESLVPQSLYSPKLFYSFLPVFPTVDNLRNFLLTTTTELLSFFQQLREAP
jgi:hypothetical protein